MWKNTGGHASGKGVSPAAVFIAGGRIRLISGIRARGGPVE